MHAEVGLKGMMVEEVDEMGRYCREGSMDRSTKNSMLGDIVGLPLAFICLDSRSRVSILRGIDRAIEAGRGGGFVFYRYGGRSNLVGSPD